MPVEFVEKCEVCGVPWDEHSPACKRHPFRPHPERDTEAWPGPYEVRRVYSNGCEVSPEIWSGRDWVATVVGAPYLGHGRTLPTAVLLSTAPELLTALSSLCNWCEALDYDGYMYICDSVAEARKVIAKAMGES